MHKPGFFNENMNLGSASASLSFLTEGPYLLKLVLLLIIGFIVYTSAKALKIWISNNASSLQSKGAAAVTKRSEVWGGGGYSRTSTSYYVTFEDQAGSRMEFEVKAKAYGMIVEGDWGRLSYQGTRFKGFVRSERRGTGDNGGSF